MNRYRVVIAGSRGCPEEAPVLMGAIAKVLLNPIGEVPKGIEIISGGARGADRLGENFANAVGLKCKIVPAKWDEYGKRAGYLRNIEMAELEGVEEIIVLWDGVSKGSKHMIDIALARNIKTTVLFYEEILGE